MIEDERILFVPPTPEDAAITSRILEEAGLQCRLCRDILMVCDALQHGVGAIILTEEALEPERAIPALAETLRAQPSWSDIPIILLTRGGYDSVVVNSALQYLRNVTLIERPLAMRTLMSSTVSAIQSRRRQYQAARELQSRQRAEEEVRRLLAETREREQSLRVKQTQLVQAAKLASIGELATGVAHELNNPLNNISLFVHNALDRLQGLPAGPDDEASRATMQLQAALEQVDRAAKIIRHLRTFAREASLERGPVCLPTVLNAALSFVAEELRLQMVTVTKSFESSMPVVCGSQTQLEQVFVNLLTNARDAVAKSDTRRIELKTEVRSEDVDVQVIDTGSGMGSDTISRIFDPFFTTKEVGQGTGLGLSIAYGIIKEHQGSITVKSSPGVGTCMTVRLPLYDPTTISSVEAVGCADEDEDTSEDCLAV
ncbi:MAG TPA: ATP-binding protein [Nitrospiraceae bacterium]|nr:ATP-binding protein [Nitrospiraceae bacterium]